MLFFGLGSLPLMQPDEGRNAEVAREMAISGSWLVPTLEGHPYLDKPAAYFAAVALSLRAFGVNEWGARIPSALCGLLVLVVVYVFARRWYDSASGALAVIVVSSSPSFFAFSRIVIMDIALTLCIVAAILASFVAEAGETPDRRWHAAGAVAVGFGMLVKGPVGALVPAAVLAVFFFVERRPRALQRVFAPRNAFIVAALFVPWFFALTRVHPEFFRYGVYEETLNRFFTPAFNRGQPFWYYGPGLLGALLPWTILFVPMVFAAWRVRERLTSADRLLVVWTIVVVVFFSMSRTKQPAYILSAVVAAGALIGRGLGHAWRLDEGAAARLVRRASLALSAAAALLAGALGWAVMKGPASAGKLAAMTEDRRAVWSMWPTLVVVLVAVAVLAAAAAVKRSVALTVAAFVVAPLVLVTVALPSGVAFARARSAKPLADRLTPTPAATEIAFLEGYSAGLSFYLGRTLTLISDEAIPLRSNFIVYWLRQLPQRPATLVSHSGREVWRASRPNPVLVLAPSSAADDLKAWVGSDATVTELVDGWWGASLSPRRER